MTKVYRLDEFFYICEGCGRVYHVKDELYILRVYEHAKSLKYCRGCFIEKFPTESITLICES